MTLITGNTYPVKDSIKKLGGKWDPVAKGWMVPDDKASEARALVGAPAAAAPRAPFTPAKTRPNWRPCGYPGCNPHYCDDCDGRGASTRRW